MSGPQSAEEREFEQQLSEHLAAELNPRLGRAGRAFDEMIRQRRRQHQRWFAIASSGSLIAASIVIGWGMWASHPPGNRSSGPSQHVENISPALDGPRHVEQLVAWQTIDEGVENIRLQDRRVPVHRLRQEAIQQFEWIDPSDKATIRVTVPRQEVLLIKQETY